MKRFYIIAILITICSMTAMAQNRPDITHQSTGRDRGGVVSLVELLTPVFTEPYIMVYGCENSNYDVTVVKGASLEWNGNIGKDYGAIIDYAFLSTESYVITVTNSRVSYEWRLEYGVLNGSRMPNWGGITDLKHDFNPLPNFGN